MDRRTFMLLTGAAAVLPVRRPRPLRALGNLRFDLDDQRRLTLWYNGPDRSVPLLRNAALGVWIGETLVTLADLQDVSVGNRRPPGGESLVIRGRTPPPAPAGTASGSVWIEAEFFALDSEARGAITITVYPDRVLATIRGIRCFATSEPDVLPGLPSDGPLVALVSGYQSWSACHIAPVPLDATSFGAIGLTRAGHGFAAVWDAGEAGEGMVKLAADGTLDAVSEWRPARPLRSDGDGATLRIAYLPSGDGLDALSAAVTPASSVDRERGAALTVPTGWCSWYELGAAVTEADMLANIDFCSAHFDRRFFRFIQLDDGYQRAAGDWDTNPKFPHGHRWLTDRVHAAGFQAGLWIAPFAVAARSDVATTNPSWLLKGPPAALEGAPLVMDTREPWGGQILALDGAHPGVQRWLYDLARRVVREWGYDYLKIDFLEWATGGVTHYGGLTRAEAYRSGLAALREGLGTEAFLLGCGAPLQQAAGLVDGMRIGDDVDASWNGIQSPARAAALRSFYHRSVWLNDPDCLVVRPPLTLEEARVWSSVVAMSGGMTIFSDNLPKLPAERLPLLQKTIPVAAQTTSPAHPVGTQREEPEVAPAITAGTTVVRLRGPWRFLTGDDARYGARDYDDETWETIAVPLTWEQSGHADYDGSAWYRTRFTLPAASSAPDTVWLDLGKVDDVDETFINGVKVGGTSGWRSYRRYGVPAAVLNWGGDNVLAVHVTDTGGPGGLWSFTRDRPASTWIVEGAPRWWTLALVNWDDEPRTVAQSLPVLGMGGARFAAYDVWAERPMADVQQTLGATIPPHSTLVVGVRPVATRPQIIGSTRHVVQGAIDIREEHWEPATRTLRARSVNLDGRPYGVTIAIPRGMRVRACKSDVACTVKRLESGHSVVEWPAGTTADMEWSVTLGSSARR
jgi:melibiase-like protein/beta-galactosidase-like protein